MRRQAPTIEELEVKRNRAKHGFDDERIESHSGYAVEKEEDIEFSKEDIEWANNRMYGPKGLEFRMLAQTPEDLCYMRDHGDVEDRAQISFLEHEEELIVSHEEWEEQREMEDEYLDKLLYWSLDER